jgi:decaprenyl-phosphate phosphoribosyltransferase
MLRAVLLSMRPHQWVKNTFVLAPLVFAQRLGEPPLVLRALIAATLFCAVSGAVYLMNDLADRERDRAHPSKQRRPIASGVLPVAVARRWVAALLLVSAVLGLWLDPWFFAALGAYFAINLGYSLWAKHVVFLDVSVIASGFLLRVLSGAVAIDVPISAWLLICTFLLSLYLALGKRKHELLALGNGTSTRRVLNSYRVDHVKVAMLGTALLTTGAYTAYTLDPATAAQFGTHLLPITVPFILYGLLRFFRLTQRSGHPESPTEQMIRDPRFLVNVLGWVVVVLVLIYS